NELPRMAAVHVFTGIAGVCLDVDRVCVRAPLQLRKRQNTGVDVLLFKLTWAHCGRSAVSAVGMARPVARIGARGLAARHPVRADARWLLTRSLGGRLGSFACSVGY